MSVPDTSQQRIMAIWVFVLCAMVVAMVVLGGITRLTHSGLSMVYWRPVTGWLPPLNEADWRYLFDGYRQSPEFRLLNDDMTLEGFKSIFWLEYLHRLWGRVMGLVFLAPFVVFLFKGWVGRRLALRFFLMFVLGAAQGVLGWYMVASGLVDEPDVSAYRLAAHLGAAMVILAYMLWIGLDLLNIKHAQRSPRQVAAVLAPPSLILLTMLSGGFVAGLDAGLTYNSFPLMDGQWLPAGLYLADPWWLSPFEDILTVQFNHRILALSTLGVVLWVSYQGIRRHQERRIRRLALGLAVAAITQTSLGVATLLLVVPLLLATLHQLVAVILFGLSIWYAHETSVENS